MVSLNKVKPTDSIQTIIACLDDDMGVCGQAYWNLKAMVEIEFGFDAADRLNKYVECVEGRYYLDADVKDCVVYDWLRWGIDRS